MAALLKGAVRTAVQAAINDAGGDSWAAADMDQLISLVEDTLFATLLSNWPDLTSSDEAETSNGSGIVGLGALTVPGRFYAIQKLTRAADGVEVFPRLPSESFSTQKWYFIRGNNITCSELTTNLVVSYSYLPTRFTLLASDATALTDYPEGHEAALIYLSAAWALTKGDQENMAQVARIADYAVAALLTHIARRYPTPTQPNLTAIRQQIMSTVLSSPLPAAE